MAGQYSGYTSFESQFISDDTNDQSPFYRIKLHIYFSDIPLPLRLDDEEDDLCLLCST